MATTITRPGGRGGGPDPLAQPTRGRLFELLRDLRRPAGTAELAKRAAMHPNSVRLHLGRLSEAGLVERRTVRGLRGRPHHEWRITPRGMAAGTSPDAYRDLALWLGRIVAAKRHGVAEAEAIGEQIGAEVAPAAEPEEAAEVLDAALAALGFQPRRRAAGERVEFVLGNCPYRDVAADNQKVVCALHRGMSRGLLRAVAPGAELTEFVAKDPRRAGCRIAIRMSAPDDGRGEDAG